MKDTLKTVNIPLFNNYWLFVPFCLTLTILVLFLAFAKGIDSEKSALQQKFLTDNASTFTIEKIIGEDVFTSSVSEHIDGVVTDGAAWYSGGLPDSETGSGRVLEMDNRSLQTIQVWFVNEPTDQILSSFVWGNVESTSDRTVKHDSSVFPVPNTNLPLTVLVRIESYDASHLQTKIWDSAEYIEHQGALKLLLGIFLGCLLGIVVQLVFFKLGRSLKRKNVHVKGSVDGQIVSDSAEKPFSAEPTHIAERDSFQQELEYKVEERTLELEIALRELSDVNKELERLSSVDTLTEVMNRRFFDKRFLAEARRSRRERTTLSVAMLDIDYFKRINDEHGHLAGDECLKQFASLLKEYIKRPADVICRYGGEEFVVILPDTDFDGAARLMEKVRSVVEKVSVKVEQIDITFTVSIGLTCKVLGSEDERETVVAYADKLLYEAKQAGRNKVIAKPFQ